MVDAGAGKARVPPSRATEFGAADEFGKFRFGHDIVGAETIADPAGAQLGVFGGALRKEEDRLGRRLSLGRGKRQAIGYSPEHRAGRLQRRLEALGDKVNLEQLEPAA